MMMGKKSKERLERLLGLVRDLPASSCDMGRYLGGAYNKKDVRIKGVHACQTAGCLAGWAATMAVADKGWKTEGAQFWDLEARIKKQALAEAKGRRLTNSVEFMVAKRWLGLDHAEASYLFLGFSGQPRGGWKKGMIKVLEHVLSVGVIDETTWRVVRQS